VVLVFKMAVFKILIGLHNVIPFWSIILLLITILLGTIVLETYKSELILAVLSNIVFPEIYRLDFNVEVPSIFTLPDTFKSVYKLALACKTKFSFCLIQRKLGLTYLQWEWGV